MRWPPQILEPFYVDDAVVLFHGDAFDVLSHVPTADAVLVDAPYSEKTHSGHDAGAARFSRRKIKRASTKDGGSIDTGRERRPINYAYWTEREVVEAVALSAPRCRGWYVSITDDVLSQVWKSALASHRRLDFPPWPLVSPGMTVRAAGDGPSNWTTWVVVARPRTKEYARWGTLPGWYPSPGGADPHELGRGERSVGGKPLWAIRAIVRDYTRPGEVVLDFCAGHGTTGVAAKLEGRRAILIERDEAACRVAAAWLERTRYQERLPYVEQLAPEQLALERMEDDGNGSRPPTSTRSRAETTPQASDGRAGSAGLARGLPRGPEAPQRVEVGPGAACALDGAALPGAVR